MSSTLTIPQFVHEDAQQVIAGMKADLEQRLNRSLAPADVEMLLINGFAYREMLLRANINDAARKNLVDFSSGVMLEYLAALVGVTRLPASGALAILRFSIVAGHTGVTIPVGIRVQSTDGKVIFHTTEEKIVAPDVFTMDVRASCEPVGTIGNGYATGTISRIMDPVAFVDSCTNPDATTGGADEESDDELRERIKLAPSSFSVAGPTGAYKYYARTASAAISDVAVVSPEPGVVNIYPLLQDGGIPDTPILDAVNAVCNDEKVRPLTDTVNVLAPGVQDYTIDADLIKLPDAVAADVEAAVLERLEAYKKDRINRLGIDVVRSQIIALCMVPGVYDVTLNEPANDFVATPEVFTRCTSITANVTGTHDE